MHRILYYRDKSGKAPLEEYIAELAAKKDKDSRIKINKIRDHINIERVRTAAERTVYQASGRRNMGTSAAQRQNTFYCVV